MPTFGLRRAKAALPPLVKLTLVTRPHESFIALLAPHFQVRLPIDFNVAPWAYVAIAFGLLRLLLYEKP